MQVLGREQAQLWGGNILTNSKKFSDENRHNCGGRQYFTIGKQSAYSPSLPVNCLRYFTSDVLFLVSLRYLFFDCLRIFLFRYFPVQWIASDMDSLPYFTLFVSCLPIQHIFYHRKVIYPIAFDMDILHILPSLCHIYHFTKFYHRKVIYPPVPIPAQWIATD